MRLIDADKLIRALKRLAAGAALEGRFEDLGEVSDAIYEVGKQPTAYDLDGVLEQMKEEMWLADREKERTVKENPCQFDAAKGYAHGIASAFEIVKGGVNNENA